MITTMNKVTRPESPRKDSSATLVQDANPSEGSDEDRREKIVVRFEPNDPTNPYNWSRLKKSWVLFAGVWAVMNSTLGSGLPAGASSFIGAAFDVKSSTRLNLPISAYLIGYVLGPIIFGPLSETIGRRPVMLYTFLVYTVFALACALAPNFESLVVFRCFTGIFAGSPIAVVGGINADIFINPIARGRSMALFMAATALGPALAPTITGYISTVSWRWSFWLALIFAGISIPVLVFLPETYGPTLLLRKAKELRKCHQGKNYVAPAELKPINLREIAVTVLTRPIRMLFTENIVFSTCIYLSLIYSIYYLFFNAYAIIFQGIYGMTAGEAGVAFLPIGGGALLSFPFFLTWDHIHRNAVAKQSPWAIREEARRLPLAMIGGPILSASIFYLAWTSRSSVPPIVPMLAGIPFGLGFILIFMALLNYITDAYEIYAASAMAATSCARSVCGAVLPLATGPMYSAMGVPWATSLVGIASTVCIAVPVGFWIWGDKLRDGSKFSREVKRMRKIEEDREAHEAEQQECVDVESGLSGSAIGRSKDLDMGDPVREDKEMEASEDTKRSREEQEIC